MRVFVVGIVVAAGLSLCACGHGSSASPAAFCNQIKNMSVQFAGLQDNPSPELIKKAAAAAEQLAAIAPPQVKSATKTEADAYSHWAKTGDTSLLSGPKFSAADDQLNAWVSQNCKQPQQ